MEKDYLISLTNKIYQLTLLFPKKEPLRYKMRELADNVLQKALNKASYNPHNPALDDLEALDSFFEVAKFQNWVSIAELLNLQEEYSQLADSIKESDKKLSLEKQEKEAKEPKAPGLLLKPKTPVSAKAISLPAKSPSLPAQPSSGSQRHQKILSVLKEKGRAQVWQVKELFPDVTKRTLRRDFENLVKQDKIERVGEWNDTFYQIKHHAS